MDANDDIVGLLPLFLMKDIFFRKYLVSNPYSNFCAVCADNKDIEDKLIEHATSITKKNKARYLELRFLGNRSVHQRNCRKEFVTMMLDLSEGESGIWDHSIKSPVRSRVRKGIKNELEFDTGNNYFNDFYKVYATNMRDLGTPVHSKLFFVNLLKTFDDLIKIMVVKHRKKVIGGIFSFSMGNTISEPWVSTLKSYNKLCPADFIYWEAIKYACAKGFKQFDYGRSTINTGTYKFKKKWGAKPVPLTYQYHLNYAQQLPIVNANDNKYQTFITIWKKLPNVVAGFIGPRIVRYLPEL